MGCDNSKPGRFDVPEIGKAYTFDVRPVGKQMVIYDESQTKWFTIEVTEETKLQNHEQPTAEQYEEWCKAGEALVHGPVGDSDAKKDEEAAQGRPQMSICSTPAGFAAVDDEKDEGIIGRIEDLWKSYVWSEEHEKITWACVRQLCVKTQEGKTVAEVKLTVTGEARADMKKEQESCHAKFHKVDYEITIDGKPLTVVGEHIKDERYSAVMELKPEKAMTAEEGARSTSFEIDGCTVETRMKGKAHCICVKTKQQCLPMAALGVGIGMARSMHPFIIEKHAAQWAYHAMREKLG